MSHELERRIFMRRGVTIVLVLMLLLVPTSAFANTNDGGIILHSYDEGYYRTLAVPCFQQENDYYCGPATVKQVVHYLNGSSQSQSYYANKIGTTTAGSEMPRICNFVKTETGKNYEYMDIQNYANWAGKIQANTAAGIPVILDIKANAGSGWPYTISRGHYINTSGFDSRRGGGVKVRVTDPCASGLGNRWYDGQVVFSVNNNHFRHAMICVNY